MNWKSLLGKWPEKNSLILAYDHVTEGEFDSFTSQIEEVGKYYQWSSVGNIAKKLKRRSIKSEAAVAFRNPRKSVLLRAVPYLSERSIPYTIFLRADCIGLNRLPPEEELVLYQKEYPDKISETILRDLARLAWREPDRAEEELRALRNLIGPLPIPKLDPTQFFSTWGQLSELDKNSVEWGVSIYAAPEQRKIIDDGILFMRRQLGIAPAVALLGSASGWDADERKGWNIDDYAAMGLDACIGFRAGAVTKVCDCYDLPVWHF